MFYTGLYDPILNRSAAWPAEYALHFYDDDGLAASIESLSEYVAQEAGVHGLAEAAAALRPMAFRADLWRYAILWACGGFYVDSKLEQRIKMDDFLARGGWETQADPVLISCQDVHATANDRFHNITGIWQGFLAAEPRHPDLLRTLVAVIDNVRRRAYFEDEGRLRMLYITGPAAMARAIQSDTDWHRRVKLPCRFGNHGGEIRTVWGSGQTLMAVDNRLHNSLRGGLSHAYPNLYKAHQVYVDDPPCQVNCHLLRSREPSEGKAADDADKDTDGVLLIES